MDFFSLFLCTLIWLNAFYYFIQTFLNKNICFFYPLWNRVVSQNPDWKPEFGDVWCNHDSYCMLLLSNCIVPCRWMFCRLLLRPGLQQSGAESLSCWFLLPHRHTKAPGLHCRHFQLRHGQQPQGKLWAVSIRLLLSGCVIISIYNRIRLKPPLCSYKSITIDPVALQCRGSSIRASSMSTGTFLPHGHITGHSVPLPSRNSAATVWDSQYGGLSTVSCRSDWKYMKMILNSYLLNGSVQYVGERI